MKMFLTTALQLLICFRLGQCYEISIDLMRILKNYSDGREIPLDVRFGIQIGEGDLTSTDVHRCSRYSTKLLGTLQLLKDTFQENNIGSIYKNIIIDDINKNNWKIAEPLVYSSLQPSKNMTIESYVNKVNYGKPTRSLSDVCLGQILSTRSCVISSECMGITSKDNLSFGYHRTHQSVIEYTFLFLKKQKCNSWITYNSSLKILFNQICTEILNESITLLYAGIPNEFHDLFLEQALVCSLAGFSEFLTEEWISQDWIQKISHPKSSSSTKTNSSIQNKIYEPSDHMAGLAIAFISRIINIACI